MEDTTELLVSSEEFVNIIKNKIDPQNTLPLVSLVKDPTKRTGMGTLVPTDMLMFHEGAQIGHTTLITDKSGGAAWFNGIEIDSAFRGKGFGLATYLAAIKKTACEGFTFRTHDWSQTEGAKRIWDLLVEKGVAKVIEPFMPDGNGKYNGKCEIKSLNELKMMK